MMGYFTVYGNTNDITHGTPTMSGCQYRQQSVLTYNVSASIPQADFVVKQAVPLLHVHIPLPLRQIILYIEVSLL
jgi:hypothetical protein